MANKSFTDRVPPRLLENPNVSSYCKVLDGTKEYKESEISIVESQFVPEVNILHMPRFCYELGQLPILPEAPKWLTIRLIENSYDLWSKKTTPEGFDLFAYCVCDGTVENLDFTNWYPPKFLKLDDSEYGVMPDGADLNDLDHVNYMYGTESFSFYYPRVSLDLKGDFMLTAESRREIMKFLVNFVPMLSPATGNISVGFYTKGGVYLETLNV